jgi:retron-type reverse transcriptase
MTPQQVEDIWDTSLRGAWSALQSGEYHPLPSHAVDRPKPDGGTRRIEICHPVDRLICRAIYQILAPRVNQHLPPTVHGWRPDYGCWTAIRQVAGWVRDTGRTWVVRADILQAFSSLDHDRIMTALRGLTRCRRLLRLIHRYLLAPVITDGQPVTRTIGAPTGSSLSPMICQTMLAPIDVRLLVRQYLASRYADDYCLVVGSEAAAHRQAAYLASLLDDIGLALHPDKLLICRVDDPRYSYLGYAVSPAGDVLIAPSTPEKWLARTLGDLQGVQPCERPQKIKDRLKGFRTYYRRCANYPDVYPEIMRRLREEMSMMT